MEQERHIENKNICKKCQTENPAENQFCSKCGNSLKGKKRNTYSIIGIITSIISLVIEIVALCTGNFICVLLVLIFSVISLISSILGIVKSIKLKKEIRKRKGLIISIISIIIILIVSFINIPMIALTKDSNTNLSNQETIIYDSIKALPSTLNAPESFRLYNVYLYQLYDPEYENGNTPNPSFGFSILIEYGGANKMGGVSRNYYVIGFKNNIYNFNEDIRIGKSKNFVDYEEAIDFAKTQVSLAESNHHLVKALTLDINKINKYIHNK